MMYGGPWTIPPKEDVQEQNLHPASVSDGKPFVPANIERSLTLPVLPGWTGLESRHGVGKGGVRSPARVRCRLMRPQSNCSLLDINIIVRLELACDLGINIQDFLRPCERPAPPPPPRSKRFTGVRRAWPRGMRTSRCSSLSELLLDVTAIGLC